MCTWCFIIVAQQELEVQVQIILYLQPLAFGTVIALLSMQETDLHDSPPLIKKKEEKNAHRRLGRETSKDLAR